MTVPFILRLSEHAFVHVKFLLIVFGQNLQTAFQNIQGSGSADGRFQRQILLIDKRIVQQIPATDARIPGKNSDQVKQYVVRRPR